MEQSRWPQPDQLPDTSDLRGKAVESVSLVNDRVTKYFYGMAPEGVITYRKQIEGGELTTRTITTTDKEYPTYCDRMLNILRRSEASYGGSGDWPS